MHGAARAGARRRSGFSGPWPGRKSGNSPGGPASLRTAGPRSGVAADSLTECWSVPRKSTKIGAKMNGESSTPALARSPETAGDRERRIAERMAMLLDITQAATSSLELEKILKIAVEKVSQVLPTDRCSVVLVDSPSSSEAVVMATRERDDYRPITIDLSKYPELRRSLLTREATYIEDALVDPLIC